MCHRATSRYFAFALHILHALMNNNEFYMLWYCSCLKLHVYNNFNVRQWCSVRASAFRTKGPKLKSHDEGVLQKHIFPPLQLNFVNDCNTVNLTLNQSGFNMYSYTSSQYGKHLWWIISKSCRPLNLYWADTKYSHTIFDL